MINSKFDISQLPDIQDITGNCVDNTLDNVKKNYRLIKEESYILLNASLNFNLSKAMTYYNLIFYVEISTKYYLIIKSELSIEKIENLSNLYGSRNVKLLAKYMRRCKNE